MLNAIDLLKADHCTGRNSSNNTARRGIGREMFPEAEEVHGERPERLSTQIQEWKQQLMAAMK